MKQKICCFIGHQKIKDTPMLRDALCKIIEGLIADEGFNTFLFGSMSEFYPLCHEIVTELKEKYPYIQRVYVRSEYPYINEEQRCQILENYEDTYFVKPPSPISKPDPVSRNCHMISSSQACVVYFKTSEKYETLFDENGAVRFKSTAKMACNHAERKGRRMINVYDMIEPELKAYLRSQYLAKAEARAQALAAPRKRGTGSIRHLKNGQWKGTFSPVDAHGKRMSCTVRAMTRSTCEEQLAAMIVEVKAKIAAEKQALAEAVAV